MRSEEGRRWALSGFRYVTDAPPSSEDPLLRGPLKIGPLSPACPCTSLPHAHLSPFFPFPFSSYGDSTSSCLSLWPRPSLNDDHFLGSALETGMCLHFSQQHGLRCFQGPGVCREGRGELGLTKPELTDPQMDPRHPRGPSISPWIGDQRGLKCGIKARRSHLKDVSVVSLCVGCIFQSHTCQKVSIYSEYIMRWPHWCGSPPLTSLALFHSSDPG